MSRETRLNLSLGLQASKAGDCTVLDITKRPPPDLCGVFRPAAADRIEAKRMAKLCRQFSAESGRDVIDKTGITGVFDIHLDLSFARFGYPEPPGTPEQATPTDGKAHSIAAQLGLELDSAKAPAEFLVIDHVERPAFN